MSKATIARNPFSRSELVREQTSPYGGCDECGAENGFGTLFRYGTEADGIYARTNWHKGRFCSKRCHDAYHGGEGI